MKHVLTEALNDAVTDWDGDFHFEIEQTDTYGDEFFFDVTVRLNRRKVEQYFPAKVVIDRDLDTEFCYMEWGEDSWEMIDQSALFTWLWFDLVDKHEAA